jgi:hypothetical protein
LEGEVMGTGIAIVRRRLSQIEGVTRTWFEWGWENSMLTKTLVVEVNFDTDPNSPQHKRYTLEEIAETAIKVLTKETTMKVSHLKIVPKATPGRRAVTRPKPKPVKKR